MYTHTQQPLSINIWVWRKGVYVSVHVCLRARRRAPAAHMNCERSGWWLAKRNVSWLSKNSPSWGITSAGYSLRTASRA